MESETADASSAGGGYGGHAGDGVGEVGSIADSSIGSDSGYSYGGFPGDGVGETGAVSTASASVADADPTNPSSSAAVNGHDAMSDNFSGFSGGFGGQQSAPGFFSAIGQNFSAKGAAQAAVFGQAAVAGYAAKGLIGALFDSIGSALNGASSSPASSSAPSISGGDAVFGSPIQSTAAGVQGSPMIGYTAPPAPSQNSILPRPAQAAQAYQRQTSVNASTSSASPLALLAVVAAIAGTVA